MSKLIVGQSIPMHTEIGTTPFGIACTYFSGKVVRDRFGFLNQFSSYNWTDKTDPIPQAKDHSLTDLMDARACQFLGKSVAAQWSGGVDSTALLLALIKNGISKEDLVILYDTNSIDEYPKLYKWLEEQKYNLKLVTNWKKDLSTVDTDLITNGWCADQLFGSVFFHQFPNKYSFSIQELMRTTNPLSGTLTTEQMHTAEDIYVEYARKLFNIDLTTAAELGWFINFIMKWTWVSTYNELYLVGTKNMLKTKVFYDTIPFQEWSVNNFRNIKNTNIYGKDASKYKKELKEYIYDVFKDEEFLIKKAKTPSWNNQVSRLTKIFQDSIVMKTETEYKILDLPVVLNPRFPSINIDTLFTKFKK